jgi:hypothetical protein
VLARINGPAKVGALPKGLNSFANPYRPNFLGDCCFKGQNTSAPEYALRPLNQDSLSRDDHATLRHRHERY